MFFTKINLMILSLGLLLAMFMPGYAKAESAYSVSEKQEALSYISEHLQMLDDSSPALQYFLDAQEDVLSGDAEPSMVREMAESYRREHPSVAETFKSTNSIEFVISHEFVFLSHEGDRVMAVLDGRCVYIETATSKESPCT